MVIYLKSEFLVHLVCQGKGPKLEEKSFAGKFVGNDKIKRSFLIIPDGLRKPILSRDVVFNERRAAEIAQLQGKSEEYDNWNKQSDQIHLQCSDIDESETEAMHASQPNCLVNGTNAMTKD